MKIVSIIILTFLVIVQTAVSKPGETYTLTGNEKSIEEIIIRDMKMFPDHYIGESLKFYSAKFKNENDLDKRNLKPGDQLIFPQTNAAFEAEKKAYLQKFIGKWRHKDSNTSSVIEYKSDGTFSHEVGEDKKYMLRAYTHTGTWEYKKGYLIGKITGFRIENIEVPTETRKYEPKKIIRITEDELVYSIGEHELTMTKIREDTNNPEID